MNREDGVFLRVLPESSTLYARTDYAVSNDNVFSLKNPAAVASKVGDALTEVLRERAGELRSTRRPAGTRFVATRLTRWPISTRPFSRFSFGSV